MAKRKDFDIQVLTGTENPANINGVRFIYADFLKASNKLALFWKINQNINVIEQFIKKSDVIYIPLFSYPIIPKAKKLGKRVIVHLHGYQPISYTSIVLADEERSPLSDYKRTFMLEYVENGIHKAVICSLASPLASLLKYWVSLSDKIICVSRRQCEVLLKFAPEYKNKMVVIYDPLPSVPEIRKFLDAKPTFLYSGGGSYVKGFYIFLKASQELLKCGVKAKFILVGNYKTKDITLIENLNRIYKDAYIMLGRVHYDEMLRLCGKAWALVVPSICEDTSPYVVLESMLIGTIPISSRVGGIPEIVGESAKNFLFKPGNVNELIAKMEELVSMKPDKLYDIGLAFKSDIKKRFNAEIITSTFVKNLLF